MLQVFGYGCVTLIEKKMAAVQVSELLEGRKRNDCQAGKTLRTCKEVESHSEETVLFQLVSAKD